MDLNLLVVEAVVATDADDTDLRTDAWSLALDQRVFGPRRLLVAFAELDGRLRSLAHTTRLDPPEVALGPCIDHVSRCGYLAPVAVAFCDEPVADGPPPPDLLGRFTLATAIAQCQGVHLVDWIACDDQLFRSTKLALDPDADWWDAP